MKLNEVTFSALTPDEQNAVRIGNAFGEALAAGFAESFRNALDKLNGDLATQLLPKVRERLARVGREDLAGRLEGDEGVRILLDSVGSVFQEIKLVLNLTNKFSLESDQGGVHLPELLSYPATSERPKVSLATPYGTLSFEW